jgi:hypothetical protein
VTDPQEVRADAEQVLRSAFAGDGDGVVDTFGASADRGGVDAACDVAWCVAATMIGEILATGPWRLDFPDIDGASYDARWVARFLSAYANSDQPTAHALFRAAHVDGQLEQCLLTLAGSAVATMRRHQQTA